MSGLREDIVKDIAMQLRRLAERLSKLDIVPTVPNNEWHWLTKNPNDLPEVGSTVIVYWRSAIAKGVAVFDYDILDHCDEYGNYYEGDYVGFIEQSGYTRLPLNSSRNPIKAWRYLPAIPGEEVE